MRKWSIAAAVAIVAAAAILWIAPWAPTPPLVYETVSGFPMRVYYRNVGTAEAEVSAVNGIPILSVDEPLPAGQIARYFDMLKGHMKPTRSVVRAGDFVRFVVDDPDRLAYEPAKTERTTYFYVMAILESPRSAPIRDKWVSKLCLVAKTAEAFKPCPGYDAALRAGI